MKALGPPQSRPALMSYLPENYEHSRETAAFQLALQPEVDLAWEARDDLLRQLNPYTADWGLDYWEDALGLPTIRHLDLEVRRRQIVVKLQGSGGIPSWGRSSPWRWRRWPVWFWRS